MKRLTAILAMCTAAGFANLHLYAEDDPKSIEFRTKFIRDFKHRIMDTAEEDAMLLRILVGASHSKKGVEVGTYRAFGAINMGIAYERTGGHLDTVDISHEAVVKSRENLKAVALDSTVTVIEGDALKVLPKLEGQYDFMFIDALKRDYLRYLKHVEPKLKPGSIIAADNTIGSARAMPDYLKYVFGPKFDSITIRATMKKNDGITLSYMVPPAPDKMIQSTVDKRKLVLEKEMKKGCPTAVDPILLRILVEASKADSGIEIGVQNGVTSINMGIAFERMGGRLLSIGKDVQKAKENVAAADLGSVVKFSEGNAMELLPGLHGKFDFVFIDGEKKNYLVCFKTIEKKLKTGSLIVVDNSLTDTDDMKDFLEYVTKGVKYETVHLRPADKKRKDGMMVIHKVK